MAFFIKMHYGACKEFVFVYMYACVCVCVSKCSGSLYMSIYASAHMPINLIMCLCVCVCLLRHWDDTRMCKEQQYSLQLMMVDLEETQTHADTHTHTHRHTQLRETQRNNGTLVPFIAADRSVRASLLPLSLPGTVTWIVRRVCFRLCVTEPQLTKALMSFPLKYCSVFAPQPEPWAHTVSCPLSLALNTQTQFINPFCTYYHFLDTEGEEFHQTRAVKSALTVKNLFVSLGNNEFWQRMAVCGLIKACMYAFVHSQECMDLCVFKYCRVCECLCFCSALSCCVVAWEQYAYESSLVSTPQ